MYSLFHTKTATTNTLEIPVPYFLHREVSPTGTFEHTAGV